MRFMARSSEADAVVRMERAAASYGSAAARTSCGRFIPSGRKRASALHHTGWGDGGEWDKKSPISIAVGQRAAYLRSASKAVAGLDEWMKSIRKRRAGCAEE